MSMKRYLTFLSCLFVSCAFCAAQVNVKSWTLTPMDGSRVGAVSPSADNVDETLGTVENGVYHAPSGKVWPKCSATAKVAAELLKVQPRMAPVKKVLGYSTREMVTAAPQSELSNWFVDNIMEAVSSLSGKKVDFGVGNFGGIRCNMPQGEVIMDDLMSMFPFKNQIVYLELQGRDIREILEKMAATRFQVLGGCRIVVKDGKLQAAEIGGEALDDSKWYSVATISFLLEGGDGLYLAKGSRNLVHYDVDIIDIVLDKVKSLTAAGKPIEYQTDDRITIL